MSQRLALAVNQLETALSGLESKLKTRLYAEADRYNDICDQYEKLKSDAARLRAVNDGAVQRVDALLHLIERDLLVEESRGAA